MIDELKRDINQYNQAMKEYTLLDSTNVKAAYELSKRFLAIADRWSEIQLDCDKYALQLDKKKTEFRDYAYQKHRMATLAHEFCRVVWRNAKDDARNSFYKDM